MASFTESLIYDQIKTSIWWTGTTIVFMILIIELRTATCILRNLQSTSIKSRGKTITTPKLLLLLPILSYFFYFILGLNALIEIYDASPCNIASIGGTIYYGAAKICMYLTFVYRVYIIYSNSLFQYNTKILVILASYITISGIVLTTLSAYTVEWELIIIDEDENDYFCVTSLKFIITALFALNDLLAGIICLGLFIRPLIRITNNMNISATDGDKITQTENMGDNSNGVNMDEHQHDDKLEMYGIVTKYCVVSAVAMLSTLIILVVIGIFKITGIVMIDISINCICIMLFNKQYHRIYKKLCCGATYIARRIIQKMIESKSIVQGDSVRE